MKKYLYAYFNSLASFHGVIQCSDIPNDAYAEYLGQALVQAPEDVLKSLKEDDLYFLGTYDNVTGVIVPCREFICHVGELANVILSSRSVKKDGDKNEAVS